GDSNLQFEYPGFNFGSYFTRLDSEYANIIGTDVNGRVNMVRFSYKGGGAIVLNLSPMTLSNFFLLHGGNKEFYDYLFSYFPGSVADVKWDDYFRYSRHDNFSSFKFLLSNPSLRWVFWLVVLLFFLMYLFESKRKQRIIPIIRPMANNSLEFVKTIGRLYYQQRDNLNLANKMATHFLAKVRTKYNLQTNFLDEEFAQKLSFRSGYDYHATRKIVESINTVQQLSPVSDDDLLVFNRQLELFEKKT
ncbi:MAG TPA: hypothetical protein VKR32_14050, partial [Puia sp.]|nr:hypothetical protein [Puia sp.]